MKVRVTFDYEPDDEDTDPEDPTGLTEAAYDELVNNVGMIGGTDIKCEPVAE